MSDDDFDAKTAINKRVQERYNELMALGKHGYYETIFHIVHEQRAIVATAAKMAARFHQSELVTALREMVDTSFPASKIEERQHKIALARAEAVLEALEH